MLVPQYEKSVLRDLAATAFHRAGGVAAARWLNRKGVRILMYHRFTTPASAFTAQLAHIRRRYAPVSLTQVAEWMTSGAPIPGNACAVTVDDGYRDFFDVAYPVLREYGIPAIVYLVSDFLDGKLWLWTDRVRYAFLHTPLETASVELPDGALLHFELDSPTKRLTAAGRMGEALKRLTNADRLALLDYLPQLLKVTLPEQPPDEYAPLRWDQVRAAAGSLIEFGAHTATHPILSSVSSERELAAEIDGSKRRIEEELDRPVTHFCYPNGSDRDIGAAAIEAVRVAGFRTAVTTETGLVRKTGDLLRLPRIGVEPTLEERYFQRCAAGFRV
jgi:peptidoglycan/xylan/chitin deacetylase (PgdA/CDA1 family)